MPEIKEAFSHQVRIIENCRILMTDGCRLAARIWMPDDAESSPVPANLELRAFKKSWDRTIPRNLV